MTKHFKVNYSKILYFVGEEKNPMTSSKDI
jgi:hypothetical protein